MRRSAVLRLAIAHIRKTVRIGIFPERQKTLISSARSGYVALQGVWASKAEMDECTYGIVLHNSGMVAD